MHTFEKLTVSGVGLLSSDKYEGANRAMITIENAPVRYRLDGEDPDAETGHKVVPGGTIILEASREIKNFRVHATTAAVLQVTYFRFSGNR